MKTAEWKLIFEPTSTGLAFCYLFGDEKGRSLISSPENQTTIFQSENQNESEDFESQFLFSNATDDLCLLILLSDAILYTTV